jgi:hypothetical protein
LGVGEEKRNSKGEVEPHCETRHCILMLDSKKCRQISLVRSTLPTLRPVLKAALKLSIRHGSASSAQAFKHAALNMRPAASSNTSRNRAKGLEEKIH